jgi:hypothetical protein
VANRDRSPSQRVAGGLIADLAAKSPGTIEIKVEQYQSHQGDNQKNHPSFHVRHYNTSSIFQQLGIYFLAICGKIVLDDFIVRLYGSNIVHSI